MQAERSGAANACQGEGSLGAPGQSAAEQETGASTPNEVDALVTAVESLGTSGCTSPERVAAVIRQLDHATESLSKDFDGLMKHWQVCSSCLPLISSSSRAPVA